MKGGGQSDKTKVVVRHLPPGISQPMFVEQIDVAFSGRYNWLSYRPGNNRLGFTFFYLIEGLSSILVSYRVV
jgi:regulator of nonsense transcripts 3